MSITYRLLQPRHDTYQRVAALTSAAWPERSATAQQFRNEDDTWEPGFHRQWYAAEARAELVGFALSYEWALSHVPGKYEFLIVVDPAYQNQGIGSELYYMICRHLQPLGLKALRTATHENKRASLRFLRKRGFIQVMREQISILDLNTFDPGRFQKVRERLDRTGVTLSPLSALQDGDNQWQQILYDLEWELVQDVPTADPHTQQNLEDFVMTRFSGPWFNPEAWTIARAGEEWIGMSVLWLAEGNKEKLYSGLTAVRGDYRRHGIATAMKLRGIAWAATHGFHYIQTANEENNPMFDLNLKLGFDPQPALLWFDMTLSEATTTQSCL